MNKLNKMITTIELPEAWVNRIDREAIRLSKKTGRYVSRGALIRKALEGKYGIHAERP